MQGTLESVLLTPINLPTVIVASSAWDFVQATFFSFLYLFFGRVFFGVEYRGSFFLAVAFLLLTTVVLACFCVITWRGLRVALRAPDSFGAFLALGLTTMVAVQALVNISVVLGLMPTKGIPLPFVSAGGSSLLINLVGMGILLNVSQHVTSSEA